MLRTAKTPLLVAALLIGVGLILVACLGATTTVKTELGELEFGKPYRHGNSSSSSWCVPMRWADGHKMSGDEMNYILQSGVYLTDKNGKYHLELDIPLTFAPDEWEWSLAFERDSRSERGPALWLHWPGNEAVSLGEAEDFNY